MITRKIALLPGMLLCIAALQGNAQQTLKGGAPDARLAPSLSGDGNQGSVYSPDLFNGTANVTVPIYSYGDKGISLNYNTAGVKLDESSGALGLHWSLNAGGSITRVVKDVPDEINTFNAATGTMGSGNLADYGLGVKGRWPQYFGGTNPSGSDAYLDEYRYMDDESDDFIFSVGGLSFTFNIGQSGFVFTHPHTNIKIEPLLDGNTFTELPMSSNTLSSNNGSLNFRVRDAQGNWYYFAAGDVSRRAYGSVELQYTSRWVVTRIVQNNGLEINYQYNSAYLNASNSPGYLYNSFTAAEQNLFATTPQGSLVTAESALVSVSNITSILYPDSTTATFVYDPNSADRCDGKYNATAAP